MEKNYIYSSKRGVSPIKKFISLSTGTYLKQEIILFQI